MDNNIKELSGANMDIDLNSNKSDINQEQDICPWNKDENTNVHINNNKDLDYNNINLHYNNDEENNSIKDDGEYLNENYSLPSS